MPGLFKSLASSVDWIHRYHARTGRPDCSLVSCPGTKPLWQQLLRRRAGAFLHGQFYCRRECLETALLGQLSRLRTMVPSTQPPNRFPLGLLMVARGKLTHAEVRAALEAQRKAGCGSIGDWIEKLGFASEQDVTAALALQWGCPVASSFDNVIVDSVANIPLGVLEAFQMIPFNYTAATNTISLAFGSRVDHAALYGIERILDCRTQPCVAPSKKVARQLEYMRQFPRPHEVEFSTQDLAEMARITSSYVSRLSPDDVRLSRIGRSIWLRLKTGEAVTNLLFRLQPHSPMPGHHSPPLLRAPGQPPLPTASV